MILRVRTVAISCSFRGPDRRVDGDVEDVPVGAAEGEVDGARELDLADELTGRIEDLQAARAGGEDAPVPIDLDPVGVARRDLRKEPRSFELTTGEHVEGEDLARLRVADVESALVGRERQP